MKLKLYSIFFIYEANNFEIKNCLVENYYKTQLLYKMYFRIQSECLYVIYDKTILYFRLLYTIICLMQHFGHILF